MTLKNIKQTGFSLIELMIAMVIGLLIIGAVTQAFGVGWLVLSEPGLVLNPLGAVLNISLVIVYCLIIRKIKN